MAENRVYTIPGAEAGARGYEIEVTEIKRADGSLNRFRRVLDGNTLISREYRRIQREEAPIAEPGAHMAHELFRRAAQNVARAGTSKGHQEALAILVAHADYAIAFDMALTDGIDNPDELEKIGRDAAYGVNESGHHIGPISQFPEASVIEGVVDAVPHGGEVHGVDPNGNPAILRSSFAAIQPATKASVRRIGKYEDGERREGWSRNAKLEALKGKKAEAARHGEMPEDAEAAQLLMAKNAPGQDRIFLDIDGFASDLGLSADLRAFLDFKLTGATLAEAPRILTKTTGQKWDARRVDRVRKRFDGKRALMADAALRNLTAYRNNQSVVLVKSSINPAGTWVHTSLLDLLTKY